MHRRTWPSGRRLRTRAAAILVLVAVLPPSAVRAQAWLPDGGETSLTVAAGDTFNFRHYLPDGGTIDVGHTRTRTLAFAGAWSPSDRWLLTAAAPFVQTQYHGFAPHPTEVDDGDEHATFTDLRVEAHFQWIDGPIAIAPFVAYVAPLHEYATLGHAAPGRGLHEYWVGVYAGASLDDWVPRTFVQVHYDYAFVERLVGISHDRNRASLEVGWFATPAWSVSAQVDWQDTLGGIAVPIPPSNPLYPYHDRIANDDFVNMGATLNWFPTRRWSASFAWATSIRGRNGHRLDRGLTLSTTFRL